MASGDTATLGAESADESADEITCLDSHSDSVHCEVLCYLQNKSKVLAFDDLIAVCGDFYSLSEVVAAKKILASVVPNKRIMNPTGADSVKVKKLLIAMLKIVLDSNIHLPVFYAVDITRLPPVGVDHVDLSAILHELTSLRQEVRQMSQIRQELDELKGALNSLSAVSSTAVNNTEFPALPCISENEFVVPQPPSGRKFAQLAADMQGTELSARRPKPRAKIIVGSSSNKSIKSVPTSRTVEVFVSRLHPATHVNELVECVNEAKGELVLQKINCSKLKSRMEGLYSSFHVSIQVDSQLMRKAIETFMSADAWPSGVFVKRFFNKRSGDNNDGSVTS